jgi:hypothetical protein
MFVRMQNRSPLGGLGCLVFGILGLVAGYYILRGLFYLLWWAAPVLFLLAVVINWKIVATAGRNLLGLWQSRPLTGLLTTGLVVLAFPVVALLLFLAALGNRRMEQVMARFNERGQNPATAPLEDEYTEFEELESHPKIPLRKEPEPLERPTEDKKPQPPAEDKKPDNPYNQLFD